MAKIPALFEGDRYRVDEHIATGGMADVYLAHDIVLDRRVVIKQLKKELLAQPDFVKMFLEEARTVAKLDHPNIIRIFDLGAKEGAIFMAIEWLEGWDLRTIVNDARGDKLNLPVTVALNLAIDACAGLHAAHNAESAHGTPLHLVHRDVSPHNLFVTTEGVVKILDFGIAKTTLNPRRTGVGMVRGKFAYMSPEQLKGEAVDHRSDVFSVGIILHELLAGRPLFSGLAPNDIFKAVTEQPVSVPLRMGEPLPERAVRVTMRALSRDRDKRYPTADDLATDLKAVLVGLHASKTVVADFLTDLYPPGEDTDPGVGVTEVIQRPRARTSTGPLGRLELSDLHEVPIPADTQKVAAESVFRGFTERIGTEVTKAVSGPRRWPAVLLLAVLVAGVVSGGAWWWRYHRPAHVPVAGVEPGKRESVEVEVKVHVKERVEEPALEPPPREPEPMREPIPTEPLVDWTSEVVEVGGADDGRGRRKGKLKGKRRTGSLSLETIPRTVVYINGDLVGASPVSAEVVPAGKVTVRLVNQDLGLDVTETVNVPAGGNVKRQIRLQPSP